MQTPTPFIAYVQNLRAEFAKLTKDTELVPGWTARTPSHGVDDQDESVTRINQASLRHAVAITMLSYGWPIDLIQAHVTGMNLEPSVVARFLLEVVCKTCYEPDAGRRPHPSEWRGNRLLKSLAGSVGTRFVEECLHGLTREGSNDLDRRAARKGRAYVYTYAVPTKEGGSLLQGCYSFADLKESGGNDEEVHASFPPEFMGLIVYGFSKFATLEEPLGRAIVVLMHYCLRFTFAREGLLSLMGMIVQIESSNT
ncbi:MAG: hypothetical protein QY323_04570 [Patescibacteria group bacterium]|nr:MAG: hypothetical protein QY323_04570 [Patescibacteria group bacterium]